MRHSQIPKWLIHLIRGSADSIRVLTTREPWPSCSKLTTSLVNDSLKFTLGDTQIC